MPLLAICQHCYETSVGSYQPDENDFEVFVCERHAPDGVELQPLPLVDYKTVVPGLSPAAPVTAIVA